MSRNMCYLENYVFWRLTKQAAGQLGGVSK
jgi:hypothetical protein